ncbi:hypothetical protein ANAPRD1_01356 [Anaplasma phagocytophilum]|nr:hypothetical protein ANAPRD1_01356 [Anaplasma phagocytophilum]
MTESWETLRLANARKFRTAWTTRANAGKQLSFVSAKWAAVSNFVVYRVLAKLCFILTMLLPCVISLFEKSVSSSKPVARSPV